MTYMKMGQDLPDGKIVHLELIVRLSDKAIIPFDERNKDYVEYLAWLDAGNEPIDFNIDLLQENV
jgi:hypothetical protein